MIFISIVLFVAVAALFILLKATKKKAAQDLRNKDETIADLSAKHQKLSRYEKIVDVEAEVERRRAVIRSEEAQLETDKAKAENQTEQILSSATQEAEEIVEKAHQRAQETASDAFEAMRSLKHYQETAKAIQNTISGYGEEYLVPNRSVLDDLAEEFSHKEAGIELKKARERSRQMVLNDLAALCDYAEQKRKRTAIDFVIDAFNGKADSILSRAKLDNFGKLNQQMEDAFNLVNHNGEAFRNARIGPEYLVSRREELRWTVAVNELRQQEIEEQRRIKREMREEERERRENEKAIREAEKEERLLQKAMKQAKQELASASAEQRAEYERKLAELEAQVREAEEKNKRAISLAQQTRRGHVYVISNIGSFGEDVFKIGLTRRFEPFDRVRELGDASVPFDFDVHAMIFSEDAPALENKLHEMFIQQQMNKVNPRKEFFRVGLLDVKKVMDEMAVEAKWTMVAEAREYRETLAIESGNARTEMPALPEDATPLPSPPPPPPPPPPQCYEPAPQPEAACPLCNASLPISTLRVGMNTCPHCGGAFEAE